MNANQCVSVLVLLILGVVQASHHQLSKPEESKDTGKSKNRQGSGANPTNGRNRMQHTKGSRSRPLKKARSPIKSIHANSKRQLKEIDSNKAKQALATPDDFDFKIQESAESEDEDLEPKTTSTIPPKKVDTEMKDTSPGVTDGNEAGQTLVMPDKVKTHEPARFKSLESKITSTSTLEEVNAELKVIRAELKNENPDMEPTVINNYLLTVLLFSGYSVENYLLSMVEGALEKKYYDFLKSLYPATTMPWWRDDDDLATLLSMAVNFPEWMSEEEWAEYAHHADWSLRFQDLIRYKNVHAYKNEQLMDSIFNNEMFKENFQEITEEAYDSGNFAFLSVVPYPSRKYSLDKKAALFFWSLAYKQEWCPEKWGEYIDEIEDIEWYLTQARINIFEFKNPKVFEHDQIKLYLQRHCMSETLETAVRFDSLSFAQYLKEKNTPEEFQLMVAECEETHTHGETSVQYDHALYRSRKNTNSHYSWLSRVYGFLLDSGKELDVDVIKFLDVSFLNEKYLKPLLKAGFSKIPSSDYDIKSLGKTPTGIEFLKAILRAKYKINRIPFVLSDKELASIEMEVLDVEAFKLIDKKLVPMSHASHRHNLHSHCVKIAIEKRDIEFLTKTAISMNIIKEQYSDVLEKAVEGNLGFLDQILGIEPLFLSKVPLTVRVFDEPQQHVPLLRYLFKKPGPCSLYAMAFVNYQLERAIENNDNDYYDKFRVIEGFDELMRSSTRKIPEFPKT